MVITIISIIAVTGLYHVVRLGGAGEQVTVYEAGHGVRGPGGVSMLRVRPALRRRETITGLLQLCSAHHGQSMTGPRETINSQL